MVDIMVILTMVMEEDIMVEDITVEDITLITTEVSPMGDMKGQVIFHPDGIVIQVLWALQEEILISHAEIQELAEALPDPVQQRLVRGELFHPVLILSRQLVRLAENPVRIRQKVETFVQTPPVRGVQQT